MLIFDEDMHCIVIDSVITPLTTDYFWALNLEIKDYSLVPFLMLEETVGPTSTLEILGFQFDVPSPWNILVYSEETMQIDTKEIGKLSGKDFTALIYDFEKSAVLPDRIKVMDYKPEAVCIGPSLNKQVMMAHPINPQMAVCISPTDIYNKYLKDCTIGDILY
jgi:hypothetical protein